MRVISNKTLLAFAAKHPEAAKPLQLWRKAIEAKHYSNFGAVKAMFGAVDKAAGYHIFNVCGNKYRLIAAIHYNRQILFIRHVFTHPQYDRWKAQ
jgi:mRNA interferase HigB